MGENERIPKDLKELLEDKVIKTVYFGDGNAIDSGIMNFNKEYPSFSNVRELEDALEKYEITHGFKERGYTVVVRNSPIENEKVRYMLYGKSGSILHAMGPLKFVCKNNN